MSMTCFWKNLAAPSRILVIMGAVEVHADKRRASEARRREHRVVQAQPLRRIDAVKLAVRGNPGQNSFCSAASLVQQCTG